MDEQKILIFEGCEKTGKSSIAKALSKVLDIPYYKDRFQKQKSPLILQLWDFLSQTGYSAIIDRDFPSYYVYYKYYNLPIDSNFYVIDELATKLDTKVIICYKTKYKNYEDEVPIEANVKLLDLYGEFLQITKCSVMHLETDSENLKEEIGKILEFLRKCK